MAESAMLGRVPLFAKLPTEALVELGKRLRRRRHDKGDTIFYQGDPGLSLCIIENGHVKLALTSPEGRELIIELLGQGDVFGELALLDGEPRSANAVATEATDLLLLERDEFIRFLLERPAVAVELLGILSRRLRRDAELMQDSAFLDVPARLARTILRLAEETAGGPPVTPRLNQRDLAGLTGTTRETLNKWLGFFQEQGLIGLHKGRISVLEQGRLRQRIV
jgi:CRP-like cAMP-binding protein